MPTERERKFLVTDSGVLRRAIATEEILQGYPLVGAHFELRVRQIGSTATIAIKSRVAATDRYEDEWEVPLEVAEDLLATTRRRVRKTRHSFVDGGITWSIDQFHAPLDGLVIAEAELGSTEIDIDLPDWCGQEVTDDRRFYNEHLAAAGRPSSD